MKEGISKVIFFSEEKRKNPKSSQAAVISEG